MRAPWRGAVVGLNRCCRRRNRPPAGDGFAKLMAGEILLLSHGLAVGLDVGSGMKPRTCFFVINSASP